MKNKFKVCVLGLLAGSIAFSVSAYADELNGIEPKTNVFSSNGSIVPYSKYLQAGYINVLRRTGKVEIEITTSAFGSVSHIYHDVTIYRNGVWVSSDRYENWNRVELVTPINVTASSGDYIDVYADHYVQNNGITEVMHSHKSLTY